MYYKDYLETIQDSYQYGTVYIEKTNLKNKSPNNKYHWIIRSEEEFHVSL